MPSDGDIITVCDERFRCESIFQAMCCLVRPAKESNCAVIFLRLPREACFDQRQWFRVSAQMLFLMSFTTFPSYVGVWPAKEIGLHCTDCDFFFVGLFTMYFQPSLSKKTCIQLLILLVTLHLALYSLFWSSGLRCSAS